MSTLTAAVDETVPVGTPAILNSPHVSEGPGRIARAPVPSIYVDDRGDIHRLRVGGKRINLLSSKEGVMRSGYLHPHSMYDFVIAGKVEVWTLTESGTEKTIYSEKEHFCIKPYVPHILYFLKDSIIAEWWDASEFSCWYYHPYRKIIDVQNSLIARDHDDAIGRHQRLIPQDEVSADDHRRRTTGTMGVVGTLLLVSLAATAGFVAGMVLGVAMGEEERVTTTTKRA